MDAQVEGQGMGQVACRGASHAPRQEGSEAVEEQLACACLARLGLGSSRTEAHARAGSPGAWPLEESCPGGCLGFVAGSGGEGQEAEATDGQDCLALAESGYW